MCNWLPFIYPQHHNLYYKSLFQGKNLLEFKSLLLHASPFVWDISLQNVL